MTCLPFIVALIINIASIVFHIVELSSIKRCKTICASKKRKNDVQAHISGIIANLIVISIIYVLCKRNMEKWAWFVVLLPFILGLVYFLFLVRKISTLKCEDIVKTM